MLSVRENCLEAQLSFFKAALYHTYIELHLPNRLSTPKSPEILAPKFGFKSITLKRFLNAVASIGLTKYDEEHNSYTDIPEKKLIAINQYWYYSG